ncbi:unnamed protein product [Rotaria magnacalcarata]|uniref:Uncharacterized protein n=2 Tax=Rotaria magnacalcarata TaxID=392030 RepID=A0A814Y9E6_9BILA|nr:unnamed protein product [Rotaria magnacalcarata]CAF2156138.1 unnamed protein product [Rotaria magnacalcarata]CAF3819091.1 unnamed protein product [Rotaria magnacalcarata]CAF4138095.1 unnamed protein product [Rotaria magnacalcarata]CAF4197273.1 unnamed protein product [Rotaria magnacalcarata]
MMKYIAVFLYLLFILIIQIDQQQAIPRDFLDTDNTHNYSSALDETISDTDLRRQQRRDDHYLQRFVNDFFQFQQHRRFGNTKYGRSIHQN